MVMIMGRDCDNNDDGVVLIDDDDDDDCNGDADGYDDDGWWS